MRARYAIATALLVGLAALDLRADISSRLCPGGTSSGCIITDGADMCVDGNNNLICDTGEPNLTMNAPTNSAGDETVMGDLTVTGDLTVDGAANERILRSQVHGLYDKNLNAAAMYGTTLCFPAGGLFTTNASATCPTADYLAIGPLPLDVQVTVLDFTCAWNKDNWDASDTVTLCATEATVSTKACVGSATFVINNASADSGVQVTTVNAATTVSADYQLAVNVSAIDDSTAGTETLDLGCSVRVRLP